MTELMKEDFLQSPTAFLSQLGEGLSKEERRKCLGNRLENVQREVDRAKRRVHMTRDDIENVRVKYENMNDLVKTMDQLKCSLEEHIRTVRLNEGSFAGTAAVLEYDNAKARTHTLINVIKARSQMERAREALAEGAEDQNRLYECLVDMQQSQETLSQFISGASDDHSLEELKDRFLAWQSTALIFAIQQADYEKLNEIQRTYETLGRKDEFTSIFRRVSIKRLKEFQPDISSFQSIIDGLHKEVEFVYTHHHKVLRRYLSDEDASTLLTDAINEGLSELDLSSPLATLIAETESPIDLLRKVEKVFSSHIGQHVGAIGSISSVLDESIRSDLISPFRSSLTSHALSKINTLELNAGSFRARVESLKTSIAELIQLLHDIFLQSEVVFGDKVKQVAQQAIDKSLDNFMVKLRGWEFKMDSQNRPRSLDDLIAVCSAAGQLVYGLQEFKTMVENIDPSLSPNTKTSAKWTRTVVEAVLKSASDSITNKMTTKMASIKSVESGDAPTARLPSFSTSPHEYVTSAGQELLQLFHRWEQYFLDDSVTHALYVAFRKKYEGDELFKKTVAEVANRVMSEFVQAVGEVKSLSEETARQFLADTGFLKDAFDDLRTGNTDQLSGLEEKLREYTKN